MEAIGECTGAGTGCGGCHDSILEIIEDEQGRELPAVAAAAAVEAAAAVALPAAPSMPAVATATPGVRRLPLVLSEVA